MKLWLAVWMGTRWDCPPIIGRFIPPAARPLVCRAATERGILLTPRRAEAEAAAFEHHPDSMLCEVRGARVACKAITEHRTLEAAP